MENWSVDENDRPYVRPATRRPSLWLVVVAIGAVAWGAALWTRLLLERAAEPRQPPELQVAPPPPQAAPTPSPPPPPVHRALRDEPAVRLPKLEHSDPLLGRSIAGLIGQQAAARLVVPEALVRRIVATVDNLPRRTAPARMLPLNAVPGAFVIRQSDGQAFVDPANFARYLPYVRTFELVVPSALVLSYVRTYPLFQRAYEELGYPGRYFNDRLIEAIDDLLLAPEIDAPLRVQRGRVLYEFADPDLETRSAGQKIMLRMGADNARRVKARLWQIRRELLKASAPAAGTPGR